MWGGMCHAMSDETWDEIYDKMGCGMASNNTKAVRKRLFLNGPDKMTLVSGNKL